MVHLALALALGLSPSLAGPPVAARSGSGALDATASFLLSGPTLAQQCTNGAYTTDQGGAITVSRASTAWCENENGNLSLIDDNKPVVEADGLRVEQSSSNRVVNSEVFTGWTATSATKMGATPDPFGGNAAELVNATGAGGYIESPSFTAGSTTGTVSLWIQGFGVTSAFRLRDTTAGVDRCTGTYATISDWPTMKARPSVACSSLVSGNNHVIRFYPAGVAGTGMAALIGVQFEPGISVKTSYIKTTGSIASRAADNVTTTITDISAAGCGSAYALSSVNSTLLNKGSAILGYASEFVHFSNDGTNSIFGPTHVSLWGQSFGARAQWSGSSFRVDSATQGQGTAGAFDGSMGFGTTLYIGNGQAVTGWLNGWIKKVKVSTDPNGCSL